MLFAAALWAADVVLPIPAVPVRLEIGGRPLVLTVSGTISASTSDSAQETLRVQLAADLNDVQRNLTEILRGQLDRSDRCGERISLQNATLLPSAPDANLTVHAHIERWGCAKVLGKEMVKRLVGGDGTIEVRVTPTVDESGTPRLKAQVTSMEASGQLGELMRAGPLREVLRERAQRAVVDGLGRVADWKGALPAPLQEMVAVRRAEFRDDGAGALVFVLTSEVSVTPAEARRLLDRFK